MLLRQRVMKFIMANDRDTNLPNVWVRSMHDLDVNIISNTSQQVTIKATLNNKISRIPGVYVNT